MPSVEETTLGRRANQDASAPSDTLLTTEENERIPAKQPTEIKYNDKGEVICSVFMLDGRNINVDLPKSAKGKDLVDKVCEDLQLVEKDWFSCSYFQNDVRFWLNPERKISKQLKNKGWNFNFQVKFYPLDLTYMQEDLTRYQLFLQLRTDIWRGTLPASFTTYCILGSFAAQSEFGDYDPSELGQGIQYLKNTVPYSPKPSNEMYDKIMELHKNYRGMSPAEAEINYLENAKVLALYGVDMHRARDESFSDVMVGVHSGGLNVYRDSLRLNRFPWAKILKLSYKRNNFSVIVRPNDKKSPPITYNFKCPSYTMAKRLWKVAVEHHGFFRLKEPEPPKRGMFPLFGSKFRYSGRTQSQARNEFSGLDRKTPTIDRAASRKYAQRGYDPENPGGIGPIFSVDRVEEVITQDDQGTATLNIKNVRKNKPLTTPTPTDQSDRSLNNASVQLAKDFSSANYMNSNIQYDQYGRPIGAGDVSTEEGIKSQEDDQMLGGPGGEGRDMFGNPYTSSTTTSSKTYKGPEGPKITEHTENKKTLRVNENMDHDKALRDAIFSVTDMNPDLSVEKIEIRADK